MVQIEEDVYKRQVEENTYNGNTSIQLMIKDIKPDDI